VVRTGGKVVRRRDVKKIKIEVPVYKKILSPYARKPRYPK